MEEITSLLDNLDSSITDGFGKPSQGDQTDEAAIVSEDDSECKTTGITDDGVIKSSKWKAILAGAVLAYNTLNSLRMAKLQRDLGQKYLELAEEHRKYYNERYKPLEISLTQEASALPKYVRDKEQFIALGLTEEQATKAAAASQEELKTYIPKHRFWIS